MIRAAPLSGFEPNNDPGRMIEFESDKFLGNIALSQRRLTVLEQKSRVQWRRIANCPYSDFASCSKLHAVKTANSAEITANPTLYRAMQMPAMGQNNGRKVFQAKRAIIRQLQETLPDGTKNSRETRPICGILRKKDSFLQHKGCLLVRDVMHKIWWFYLQLSRQGRNRLDVQKRMHEIESDFFKERCTKWNRIFKSFLHEIKSAFSFVHEAESEFF